jgi:hypothetical protein
MCHIVIVVDLSFLTFIFVTGCPGRKRPTINTIQVLTGHSHFTTDPAKWNHNTGRIDAERGIAVAVVWNSPHVMVDRVTLREENNGTPRRRPMRPESVVHSRV